MTRRSQRLGVAILGYGAIAERHAIAMSEAGADLRAVAGPATDERDAFARRHAIPCSVAAPEDAIARDGVDVVVVASPSPNHGAQARSALMAGRHVLVEIPLALSTAEAEALADVAHDAGLQVGVCQTQRFLAPVRAIQAVLDASGDRPSHVAMRTYLHRRANVGWTGRPRSWTDDIVWHHGGHAVDTALRLLRGTVDDVRAVASFADDRVVELAVVLRTDDHRIATLSLSYNARIPIQDGVVITDRDTYAFDVEGARSSTQTLHRASPTDLDEAILAQDAAFLAAVRHGAGYPANADSIIPTLRILTSIDRCIGR